MKIHITEISTCRSSIKIDNETVQVKSLGYNEDIIINHNTLRLM